MERTLVLLKPDTVERGLVGTILARFEARGLKITALRMLQLDRALAERQYAVHTAKDFFEKLVAYITAGPVVAAILEGQNAVEVVRRMMGPTDCAEAAPGTIRGDLGLDIGRNLVHGSDGPESAEREISLFFHPQEILSYPRSTDPWIKEP